MDAAIVPKEHDRVTVAVRERSTLGYVWSTVGGALLLTMAMAFFIVWSSLVPAKAGEERVVRAPGKGFYKTEDLSGAAAVDIRAYMDRTWVECDDFQGHGRCNLNASTEYVSVRYVDDYAVAFLAYANDTGNVPGVRLGLWEKRGDGRYDMLAHTDDMPLLVDMSVTDVDGKLRLSGLVQGPNDAFCCPTTKASFDLSYADGKVTTVAAAPQVAKTNRRLSSNPFAALAGAPAIPMQSFAIKRPKSKISGFDFRHDNYAGEAPFVFFHNGSEMMVFPDHGIIAYKEPKVSIAKVVHETDILFEGTIGKSGVFGTAYVFKQGCAPLPYRVSGPGYRFDTQRGPPVLVLKGMSPVHARNSCEVIGTTATGPNSVLRFEPAGVYGEDAYEEETHSGLGYERVSK